MSSLKNGTSTSQLHESNTREFDTSCRAGHGGGVVLQAGGWTLEGAIFNPQGYEQVFQMCHVSLAGWWFESGVSSLEVCALVLSSSRALLLFRSRALLLSFR